MNKIIKRIFITAILLGPLASLCQQAASEDDVHEIAKKFSQTHLKQYNPDISFITLPTSSQPIYEVSIGGEYTLLISSQKFAKPVLMVVKDDNISPILNNPNLPDGMQYFIEKYSRQIKFALDNIEENVVDSLWIDLLDSNSFDEITDSRNTISPLLSTVWGQSRPNDSPWEAAYNYYINSFNESCQGGAMGHKCLTGCVATAMAQIMKYWNYPVFRYGKSVQYDWCNMPDSLNYYLPSSVPNPAYEIQRNAIARLMADCGEAADMHYCYMNDCQSFTWPINARNALVDSFQYNSDAVRRLRSSYSAQTWKDFLIQDLQNGHPVLYAGASLATGDYDMSGHAFVCDGYNSATDMFHFNWGWVTASPSWCALDAIIIDDYNYSHFERAVFNIYPSTDDNYCNFDLQLWQHYITYYNPSQTTPPPYQNVPKTATRLYSVPISVPDGSGNHYFDASWRTIPSGDTSEYVTHKEVVLQPGFTASNGCNFTARIEPCAECEAERNHFSTPDINERSLVSQHQYGSSSQNRADSANALTLFPNPTNSTVTLQLSDPQDEIRQITIANMQGQVMLSLAVNATTPYTLDISSLPAGIYVVRVLTANGTVAMAKVVKK